jgi:nucleoside-diphosphate-sugar epimerase
MILITGANGVVGRQVMNLLQSDTPTRTPTHRWPRPPPALEPVIYQALSLSFNRSGLFVRRW